ncbi:MAG: hypothetical protein KDA41_17845, partial [Planctomycetales bacterium]|nr:hypothetical protein [Planctomycetales bacterium]
TVAEQTATVAGLAFTTDGKHLLTAARDGRIVKWKTSDGKKAGDVVGAGAPIHDLRTSGRFAVAACGDKTVRLIDRETAQQIGQFRGHAEETTAVAISADGAIVAGGGFDGVVYVWNRESGEAVCHFVAAPGLASP